MPRVESVAVGTGGTSGMLELAIDGTVSGPIGAWAGLLMVGDRVVLTAAELRAGGVLWTRRRCPREAFTAIGIRQDDFGRAPRAVPFAVLGDGAALELLPLSTLLSRYGQQLEHQLPAVDSLRAALGVGGANLSLGEVRWPATSTW